MFRREVGLLIVVALVAGVISFRATHQNLTGDEASTYTRWVEPWPPTYWTPDSNNHLLNSLLISVSTKSFGNSPTAIRLPAMLAGFVFIGLVACLARRMFESRLTAAVAFLLVTFSPFLLELSFAARGYAYALAGQIAVFFFIYRHLSAADPLAVGTLRRHFIPASTAAGVSTLASFPFAPVMLVTLGVYYLATMLGGPAGRPGAAIWLRAGAMMAAPFLLVVWLIGGHTILNFPLDSNSLIWGTQSLGAMIDTIAERIFQPPNERLMPPHLVPILKTIADWGPILAATTLVVTVLIAVRERRAAAPPEPGAARNFRFGTLCLLILALSTVGFIAGLYVLGQPLPLGRTGVMLVMPFFLALVAFALSATSTRAGAVRTGVGMTGVLLLVACFIGSVRFDAFSEWTYDADVREAIAVAGPYMKERGIRRIGTTWHFTSTANYYRKYLGFEMDEVRDDQLEDLVDGYDIYLAPEDDRGFIESRKLRVLFTGPVSRMRVAVRDAP